MVIPCAECGTPTVDAQLVAVGDKRICRTCAGERGGPSPLGLFKHPAVIIGGIAGLLPFFAHFTSSSEQTVNGEVVAATYRDYVAIGCGPVALLCGAVALAALAKKPASPPAMRFVPGAILILLGLFQLARGFGAI